MKKCFILGLFCAVIALLSGCANFVNSNQSEVLIETNKPAKIVMLDYLKKPYHKGETPLKIKLPHRTVNSSAAEFWLQFTDKENPENKKEFFIKAQTSKWFYGNLLFIHPIAVIWGFIIDLDSDGRYCFEEKYSFDI